MEHQFLPGDLVIRRSGNDYAFTEGKQYTVLKYEPERYEASARFTWPAYVTVTNDNGRKVRAHARRFIPKE